MHAQEADRLRRKIKQEIQNRHKVKKECPSGQLTDTLNLQYIMFQKIHPVVRKLLQDHYSHLKKVIINNCDLRTFQNFPYLPQLKEVNAAKNSMRGSFQFIVKNKTITYIDVSDNLIADIKRFEPFRILRDISVFAKGNPFMLNKIPNNLPTNSTKQTIGNRLKAYGISLLKQAKKQHHAQIEELQKQDNQKNQKNQKIKEQENSNNNHNNSTKIKDILERQKLPYLSFGESDEEHQPIRIDHERFLINGVRTKSLQNRSLFYSSLEQVDIPSHRLKESNRISPFQSEDLDGQEEEEENEDEDNDHDHDLLADIDSEDVSVSQMHSDQIQKND